MIFYQEKSIELYLATLVKGVGCTPQISEDLPNICNLLIGFFAGFEIPVSLLNKGLCAMFWSGDVRIASRQVFVNNFGKKIFLIFIAVTLSTPTSFSLTCSAFKIYWAIIYLIIIYLATLVKGVRCTSYSNFRIPTQYIQPPYRLFRRVWETYQPTKKRFECKVLIRWRENRK